MKGPLPARRRTCSVEGCAKSAIPTWPWCEAHRPKFDRQPIRTPCARHSIDLVREAFRRWPDWEDEAIAAYAGVSAGRVNALRSELGFHRRQSPAS